MCPPLDPISLAQDLIRCPSVTPDEAGALALVEVVLKEAGFTCHRMTFSGEGTYDVENLYARIGTEGPNLCFAGHTDVVPPGDEAAWTMPPFAAEIHDGVLYGRGAVDMKGAVACFIVAALRHLETTGGQPRGSLSFLITGDEEGESINGTVKLIEWIKERGETLDACVVGEPSSRRQVGDEIKIGRRGTLNGELIVSGKQGHSAYPHVADNPLPKLARIIDRLSALELDTGTKNFEPSHIAVTVVSVPNTATNVIPGQACIKFNARYNDTHTRTRLEALIRRCCKEAAAEVDAEFTLAFSGTGDVFVTKPGPLVDTMVSAVREVTDHTPNLTTTGGTSDARFIKDVCPVVEFGLVNSTIHQADERVSIADLETLTRVYERFIARYFSQA